MLRVTILILFADHILTYGSDTFFFFLMWLSINQGSYERTVVGLLIQLKKNATKGFTTGKVVSLNVFVSWLLTISAKALGCC